MTDEEIAKIFGEFATRIATAAELTLTGGDSVNIGDMVD